MTVGELRQWKLAIIMGQNELAELRLEVCDFIEQHADDNGTLFGVPVSDIVVDFRDFLLHYSLSEERVSLFYALIRYVQSPTVQEPPHCDPKRVVSGLGRVLSRVFPRALCDSALGLIPTAPLGTGDGA